MEETTNKSGMSTGMIIGIAVMVAIVFGGGAYAYVNNKAEKEKKDLNAQITKLQSQVSNATTATTTMPSSSTSTTAATDVTANWKTYTNSKYSFSVKYPKTDATGSYPSSINTSEEWIAKEITVGGTLATINFGPPSSAQGGYIWGINVMSGSTTTLDKQIAGQGDQWSDRKESKQTITIDGSTATIVTVTTASQPDWISKVVYIEKGGNIFEISNGAIQSTSFDPFYKSFQFTK